MSLDRPIRSPDDPALDALTAELADRATALDAQGGWPAAQLAACARAGVFEWFVPREAGGQGWSDVDVVRGYLRLSAACLTTTFIITQRAGACRRIAESAPETLRDRLLPPLLTGETFATVGISHLTTSRRHLGRPVLSARETADGFRLDGYSPWVTGAIHAHSIVLGATLEDGRQVLLAMPTDLPGIELCQPLPLVGLSGSHTGEVRCHDVTVGREWLLAGPEENVMSSGQGAATGGLQTSTLAVGLTLAAVEYLEDEAARRDDLRQAAAGLRNEVDAARDDLLALAAGTAVCTAQDFRARANSLVLRSTQAALAAAKGSGYVVGHRAGRWCREALFFLVWSCPQPVMAANLCELAGLSD